MQIVNVVRSAIGHLKLCAERIYTPLQYRQLVRRISRWTSLCTTHKVPSSNVHPTLATGMCRDPAQSRYAGLVHTRLERPRTSRRGGPDAGTSWPWTIRHILAHLRPEQRGDHNISPKLPVTVIQVYSYTGRHSTCEGPFCMDSYFLCLMSP